MPDTVLCQQCSLSDQARLGSSAGHSEELTRGNTCEVCFNKNTLPSLEYETDSCQVQQKPVVILPKHNNRVSGIINTNATSVMSSGDQSSVSGYRSIVLPLEGEPYEAVLNYQDIEHLMGGLPDSKRIANLGSLGFIYITFHDEFIRLGLPQNPHVGNVYAGGSLYGVCILQTIDSWGETVHIPPAITPANWKEAMNSKKPARR